MRSRRESGTKQAESSQGTQATKAMGVVKNASRFLETLESLQLRRASPGYVGSNAGEISRSPQSRKHFKYALGRLILNRPGVMTVIGYRRK